jgi:hypothetical protein
MRKHHPRPTLAVPRRKIANWTTIREMCRRRFTDQTTEEVEVRAVELARAHGRRWWSSSSAKASAKAVMEEAATVAMDVVVGKMHAVATRKTVEVAMVTLCAIHNDAPMVALEAVAKEAAMIAVRELCEGVVVRRTEAQMYIDDAAAEDSCAATAAVVAVERTSAWLLVDGDDTEVEDDDKDEEAEAERDTRLCASNKCLGGL